MSVLSSPVARPAAPAGAVAVDLGSGSVGVWAMHRGTVSSPGADTSPIIRRGRIVDAAGCLAVLAGLLRRYTDPVQPGGVVVACRPVLSTPADEQAVRRLLTEVFAPSRLLMIDTVRAAAVGAGAAAGTLVVADVGAQLTEVAVLHHGHTVAARRTDLGTGDLDREGTLGLLAGAVARHVAELRADPAVGAGPALTGRGLLLVGDGALHPELSTRLAAALRTRVHGAAAPRTAALTGAGLAAMAALRHPAAA